MSEHRGESQFHKLSERAAGHIQVWECPCTPQNNTNDQKLKKQVFTRKIILNLEFYIQLILHSANVSFKIE